MSLGLNILVKGVPRTHFTNSLWACYPNLEKIHFAVILILIFQSDHNFAHILTCAKLWQDWIIIFQAEAKCILARFNLWAHKLGLRLTSLRMISRLSRSRSMSLETPMGLTRMASCKSLPLFVSNIVSNRTVGHRTWKSYSWKRMNRVCKKDIWLKIQIPYHLGHKVVQMVQ